MEPNRIVKMALAETRISLEQFATEVYGISKQAMSQKLKKELPESVQQEMKAAIIEMARERVRRVEEMS